MLKNPGVMEKAQEEVRKAFDGSGNVQESGLHELKYLQKSELSSMLGQLAGIPGTGTMLRNLSLRGFSILQSITRGKFSNISHLALEEGYAQA